MGVVNGYQAAMRGQQVIPKKVSHITRHAAPVPIGDVRPAGRIITQRGGIYAV